MKIEVWSNGELFQTTRVIDYDDFIIIAADKIANSSRKHGITIWFE